MSLDNYDASTALSAYYPSREERRPARLWATEKLLHDMAELGMVEFFEGTGTDPTALDDYSITKLWLRVSSGVTEAPGEVRAYDGNGSASDIANWPELTRGAFLDFLGVRPDLGRFETRADAVAAIIAPSVNGLTTLGYASVGDGDGAVYKRAVSEPSHDGKFQSSDGAWWEQIYFADDSIETRSDVEGAVVAAAVNAMRTLGYATAGDGGGAVYKRVETEPAHTGKVQSADGAWWELASGQHIHVEMFGARAYSQAELEALDGDSSIDTVAAANDTAFQDALDYIEDLGGGTVYGLGNFYIFGSTGLRYPPGCYFEGAGHGKWMPSFPTEAKTWVGTNLVPKPTGATTYTVHGITSSEKSGGWRTDPDDGTRKFKLTSFMNRDASGTTPATPKAMSVFMANKYRFEDKGGVRRCRIVPWIGTDGISDYSTQSGTDLGADWDIGLLVDTMEGVTCEDVQVRGYWRMIGLAEVSPDFLSWSRSECNRFIRCSATGFVGVAIRSGQQYKVLSTSIDGGPGGTPTATIVWDAESIWPASGQLNAIQQGYVQYTSLSRDGANLVFEGLSVPLTGSGYIRNPYRGTGFSTGAFYDCEGWALWHHSGQKAEDLGFDRPSTGFECSGYPMRGLNFFNCSWFGEDTVSPAMHIHNCFDPNFFGGKAEIGHVIASPFDTSQEDATNGAGSTSNIGLEGFQFSTSIDKRLWTPRSQRNSQEQWNPLSRNSSHLHFEAMSGQNVDIRMSTGNRVRLLNSSGGNVAQFLDSGTVTIDSRTLTFGSGGGALISAADSQSMSFRAGTTVRWQVSAAGNFLPGADDTYNIGASSAEVNNIFLANSPVVSSDAIRKRWRGDTDGNALGDVPSRARLSDAEKRAFRRIVDHVGVWRFLGAIATKGDASARWHIGPTVQLVVTSFESEGLDPWRYAPICADPLMEQVTKVRIIKRQKMETVEQIEERVVIEDGIPILKRVTVPVDRVVTVPVPIVDEVGAPVTGEDGTQILHQVPVMEDGEESYIETVPVVDDAGQQVMRLSLRQDELLWGVIASLAP